MNLSVSNLVAGLVLGLAIGTSITYSAVGRYYVTGKPSAFVLVDKFTGELKSCDYFKCEPIQKEEPTKATAEPDFNKIRKATDALTAFGDRMQKSLCDEPLKPLPKMDGVYLPPDEETKC